MGCLKDEDKIALETSHSSGLNDTTPLSPKSNSANLFETEVLQSLSDRVTGALGWGAGFAGSMSGWAIHHIAHTSRS